MSSNGKKKIIIRFISLKNKIGLLYSVAVDGLEVIPQGEIRFFRLVRIVDVTTAQYYHQRDYNRK
jgi:hypothetical protein